MPTEVRVLSNKMEAYLGTTNVKRPESILVVVHTAEGLVLMLRRVAPNDFWQSVTGSLRWGERANQAARRELQEETGLSSAGRLIDCAYTNRFPIVEPWKSRYAPDVHYNTEHVFRYELQSTEPIALNPYEHTEYRWVPWVEAAQLASSWTDRDAIRRYFESAS